MILVVWICCAAEQIRLGLDRDERGGDGGLDVQDGAGVLEQAHEWRGGGDWVVRVAREPYRGVVAGHINRVFALLIREGREMKRNEADLLD
jgi:hypothetical protein